MSEQKEIKFVRFKNSPEDIVGIVTFHQEHITIENPLVVDVETLFDEGRQVLSIREYLPQSIISIREVDFNNNEVLFTTPVREDFKEQYEQVSKFFYEDQPAIQTKPKRKRVKPDTENVISLFEALKDKKDKPVH
jgi:hypothetical protein